MFVCCMLDLFTREIVGWAIDSHMRKSLVHDASSMSGKGNCFDNAPLESFWQQREGRGGARAELSDAGRSPPVRVWLHRGFLQHYTNAFVDRLVVTKSDLTGL